MSHRNPLIEGELTWKDRAYNRIFFPKSEPARFLSGVLSGLIDGATALHAAPTFVRRDSGKVLIDGDPVKEIPYLFSSAIPLLVGGGMYIDSLMQADLTPISEVLPIPIEAPLATIPLITNILSGVVEGNRVSSKHQKLIKSKA
jgi:hypothetical protein